MRSFTMDEVVPETIVSELLDGAGAVKITGMFTSDEISQARDAVMAHSDRETPKVTHFQGAAEEEGNLHLQRRVWNLLAKGEVFSRIATHPTVMAVLREFLGSEFIMGSIAANRILPGGPGQEPHIDYPYWDYYKTESHPARLNSSFPVNAQLTMPLDPFTEESGASAYVPGSQKSLRYPTADDRFFERCERMLGEPGDGVLFYGAAWHCAMPNRSSHDRSAVLVNYLPKWVKPLEDMPAALPQELLDTASPDLRQLLGFNYPYPEVLDAAEAGNTEGQR